MKYRCPNGCEGREFSQFVPIWQEWRYDENGDRIDIIDEMVETVGEVPREEIRCFECNAVAEEVD